MAVPIFDLSLTAAKTWLPIIGVPVQSRALIATANSPPCPPISAWRLLKRPVMRGCGVSTWVGRADDPAGLHPARGPCLPCRHQHKDDAREQPNRHDRRRAKAGA